MFVPARVLARPHQWLPFALAECTWSQGALAPRAQTLAVQPVTRGHEKVRILSPKF